MSDFNTSKQIFEENDEEEENDCPFDMAIEDIDEELEEKEDSPLKLTKQKSSDTILQ